MGGVSAHEVGPLASPHGVDFAIAATPPRKKFDTPQFIHISISQNNLIAKTRFRHSNMSTEVCANCKEPLLLEVEPDSDYEDDCASTVPDDVELNCGCHFHW
jgi:hypothetical protein